MDITVHIIIASVMSAGIIGLMYITGVADYIRNLE